MYGHSVVLHLLHHIVYTVALGRVCSVIVVVEQLCVRVSLMRPFEDFGYKLLSTEVHMFCLAVWAWLLFHPGHAPSVPVGDGLIQHIPRIHDILISAYDCQYMLAQAFVEDLFLDRLPLLVGEHPVGEL